MQVSHPHNRLYLEHSVIYNGFFLFVNIFLIRNLAQSKIGKNFYVTFKNLVGA